MIDLSYQEAIESYNSLSKELKALLAKLSHDVNVANGDPEALKLLWEQYQIDLNALEKSHDEKSAPECI